MSLWSYFRTNQGRAIWKWCHYFPIYERHFARFVNLPTTILEIGCGEGGSLQMWRDYFGPHATIVGLDIEPGCKEFEEDQISVRIGDQKDCDFLHTVVGEFGSPDIVIDDGSHVQSDVCKSWAFLYPRLQRNGVYLVEDLHTAYYSGPTEGGCKKPGTFIEVCKDLIDELNGDYWRGMTPTHFQENTLSMHFYDSVVVFEKGKTTHKHSIQIGHGVLNSF